MKRFNRQVKDAKRQQKVSVKPAQPARADAQSSDRKYYKWDDRLLPIVKEFIQTCPEIARLNQIDNSTVRNGVLREFFANYNSGYRPDREQNIYYMRSKGWDSRNRFRIADVICSYGLYSGDFEKSLFKRDSYYRYMSWEEFLNIEENWRGGTVWYKSSYARAYTHFDFVYEGDSMQRLQKLLRKKSVALEEGRPI